MRKTSRIPERGTSILKAKHKKTNSNQIAQNKLTVISNKKSNETLDLEHFPTER